MNRDLASTVPSKQQILPSTDHASIPRTTDNGSVSPTFLTTDVEKSRDDSAYPEGGLRAWSVVLGSFCGMTSSFGQMNSVGVFQDYLSTHQLRGYSAGSIGWIFSIYIFLSFFCGIQIGPVFDARGPRLLVLAGTCLILLSQLLLAVCTSLLPSLAFHSFFLIRDYVSSDQRA